MRKGTLLMVSVILFLSININCNNSGNGILSGNGNLKTETRSVGDFSEVKSTGSIDIEISVGDKFEVKAQDDENLLPKLITEVKNGVLNVYYDGNSFMSESHGKVMVTVPTLNKVSSSGSGDIKIEGTLKNDNEILFSSSGSGDLEGEVDAPAIRVSTAGSGDVSLKGNTKKFDCQAVGSGDVKCRDLKSENVSVSVSGSSDVSVFASVSLKVSVTGSGDVTYSGNPASPEISTTGSGTVSKAN